MTERVSVRQILPYEASMVLADGRRIDLDCVIDVDETVRPMVGGGQPITNFMLI